MISTMILFSFSVLSNKLDAPMLNGIIAALSQEIVPQGNCQFQCELCVRLKRCYGIKSTGKETNS